MSQPGAAQQTEGTVGVRDETLLQRLVLPRAGESAGVRRLYVEHPNSATPRAHAIDRSRLRMRPDTEVSFATYFNAFPAAYWRRWTTLRSVVLQVELSGRAGVQVYRSKSDAAPVLLDSAVTGVGIGDQSQTLRFELPLTAFEDGGWMWFDVTAEEEPVVLERASWHSPSEPPGGSGPEQSTVAIGIPTFNRPADAVQALLALTSDPVLDARVGAVVMVDQGTKKAKDEPGFAEAAARLGDRLAVHHQGNFGGSGGYARVMHEALTTTKAERFVVMDDDVDVEPESILRLIAFGRWAQTPTIVGGQMLNLQERSHLHSMGEVLDRVRLIWEKAPNTRYDHDFARTPLLQTKQLHRRVDVEFNGWWLCLIPRKVLEDVGLPMPFFIKWDDVELALRARKAGYPTVGLPGAAIWHMAWADKDDRIDWQSYFHLRNRLIVAALHHDGSRLGLYFHLAKATLFHALTMEYSTLALQLKAVRDFKAGPEGLHELLPKALGEAQALRKNYPDAQVIASATELPLPSGRDMGGTRKPLGRVGKAVRMVTAVAHQLSKENPEHHERPQANVSSLDAWWWMLSKVDGVTVTVGGGSGVVYRKRSRAEAVRLAKEFAREFVGLARDYSSLAKRYRAAAHELTSEKTWLKTFGVKDGA
jgi:galactofuranosylgalactofuranosylrhamnosyl-N-acetylglucosaminyl-diphospho-decaprenol beta-1,5/1,6-galactofuranosyltransferase